MIGDKQNPSIRNYLDQANKNTSDWHKKQTLLSISQNPTETTCILFRYMMYFLKLITEKIAPKNLNIIQTTFTFYNTIKINKRID